MWPPGGRWKDDGNRSARGKASAVLAALRAADAEGKKLTICRRKAGCLRHVADADHDGGSPRRER